MNTLGGLNWSNPNEEAPQEELASSLFLNDAAHLKVTNSIGDLLEVKRSRNQRQLVQSKEKEQGTRMMTSGSAPNLDTAKVSIAKKGSSLKVKQTFTNLRERPPNKQEIEQLEQALLQQARAIVMMDDISMTEALESKSAYHPQAVDFKITEEKMVSEFEDANGNISELRNRAWLRDLIKFESLQRLCDEKSSLLSDMISVQSGDLGNALRQLRSVYMQTHHEMKSSFKNLYKDYVKCENSYADSQAKVSVIQQQLNEEEDLVSEQVNSKLGAIRDEYEAIRSKDRKELDAARVELKQTQLTLKNLNVIFKTMQEDSSQVGTLDMQAKCERLQREVAHLTEQNAEFEVTRKALEEITKKADGLERANRIQDHEIKGIRAQLGKRDETIAKLMEKDSLRQAEIEQLQRVASLMQEKEDEDDFEEPPTTVLCVKCKKSLDDLTNIRAAVTGQSTSGKMPCQSYRVLLPNLGGRRPHRTNDWLRLCMRNIIIEKMKEDVVTADFRGVPVRLPEYIYAWFERESIVTTNKEGVPQLLSPAEMAERMDEDRWGFYYGIKALARDDPEASLIYALLDESQGEDGLAFVLHCLSIALSISGADLWQQLGPALLSTGGIRVIDGAKDLTPNSVPSVIWLNVNTAKDVIRTVFTKAMEKQIKDTLESVEAMTEVPGTKSALFSKEDEEEHPTEEQKEEETAAAAEGEEGKDGEPVPVIHKRAKAATHVNLFAYLRFLLGKYQEERAQRGAAVKLMFEAAAVGALTPTADPNPKAGEHIEFPQFQAVIKTLNPSASVVNMAHVYNLCYERGNHKVTAPMFLDVADQEHLFSSWLRLQPLPLLRNTTPQMTAQLGDEEVDTGAETATTAETETDADGNPIDNVDETRKIKLCPLEPVSTIENIMRKTEASVRMYLGSIVHRHYSMMKPYLQARLVDLPEKWRSMLKSAIDRVDESLRDAWNKMKKRDISFGLAATSEAERNRVGNNMDGLQPFVHYQRLLTSLLAVEGFNSSPILPTELVRYKDMKGEIKALEEMKAKKNSKKGGSNEQVDGAKADSGPSRSALDLSGVESLLSHLEHSVIYLTNAKQRDRLPLVPRYHSYEKARRSLVARRIQIWFRKYATDAADKMLVPRSMRLAMRATYLRGCLCYPSFSTVTTNTDFTGKGKKGGQIIRKRRVQYNPWWALSYVAEVYAFKINYDAKVVPRGRPPISLEGALAAYAFYRYGSLEVSERTIHDLFLCCKQYQKSLPRLKLFLAFFGNAEEMDPLMASIMTTDVAMSRMLDLLVLLHHTIDGTTQKESTNKHLLIDVLFKSSGNKDENSSQVDAWRVPVELLEKPMKLWLSTLEKSDLTEYGGIELVFMEALKQCPVNRQGMVNVDDFLWIMLTRWSKSMGPMLRKTADRLNRLEKKAASTVPLIQVEGDNKRSAPDTSGMKIRRLLTSEEVKAFAVSLYANQSPGDAEYMCNAYMEMLTQLTGRSGNFEDKADTLCVDAARLQAETKRWVLLRTATGSLTEIIDQPRLHCRVVLGTDEKILVGMARVVFNAYHDCIGDALMNISSEIPAADQESLVSLDVARAFVTDEKKILEARQTMIKLEELLGMREGNNKAEGNDMNHPTSISLVSIMDEKISESNSVSDLWALLGRLFVAVEDLFQVRALALKLKKSQRVFPMDNWIAGEKIIVEKSACYTVKLR